MFVLGRPSLKDLDRVLAAQAGEPLTYRDVGATRGVMPEGYRHDRHEVVVGAGAGLFDRAVEGLRQWETHRGAGLTLRPEVPELAEGVTIVQALTMPLISAVAACRIVYVTDEPHAFGFAYGTLPTHPEEGEEASASSHRPTGRGLAEWPRPAAAGQTAGDQTPSSHETSDSLDDPVVDTTTAGRPR